MIKSLLHTTPVAYTLDGIFVTVYVTWGSMFGSRVQIAREHQL